MNDFELAQQEIKEINDSGEYIGKYALELLFFKKVTKRIFKPMTQDDLEFLLIKHGLSTPMSQSKIKLFMNNSGFRKNNMMIDGERKPRWVNDTMKASPMSQKIRFTIFLKEYLSDKTEMLFTDLRDIIRDNNFETKVFDRYFFNQDGTYRECNGWKLIGKGLEKIYKKVHSESENLAE